MNDNDEDALDARLRKILAAERVAAGDDAFVAQVMRRVRHRMAIRRAVLGIAASLGVAVAAMPLTELATRFGVWLASHAAEIRPLDAADLSLSSSIAIVLTALCLAVRSLTR